MTRGNPNSAVGVKWYYSPVRNKLIGRIPLTILINTLKLFWGGNRELTVQVRQFSQGMHG